MRRTGVIRMKHNEQAVKRLMRPPSVANWTRHNFRRLDDTRRGLLRFATVPPIHSLAEVYSICEAIVTDQISLDQALKCAISIAHPVTRKAAIQIIPIFFNHAQNNSLDGISAFKGFNTSYPIGRAPDGKTMVIPVSPTFTILENGLLTPVFLIAWSTLSLNDYQKQLMSTIICNAILTQQDFSDSDALVICTPKYKSTEVRHIRSWKARDYAVLTDDQLQDQFLRYGTALADVMRTLRGE